MSFFFINVTFTFQSKGQTLKEAVYINRSLSFLEQTILALADRGREHVPFRQSKLTHALKDSLGETARPCICICFAKSCCAEGLVNHDASVHSCRRKLQHCACGQHLWWGCTDRRNSKEQNVWYQTECLFLLLYVVSCISIPRRSLLCVSPAEWSVSGRTLLLMNTWIQQWVQRMTQNDCGRSYMTNDTYCFCLQSVLCCTLCQSVINSVRMKCAVVIRFRSRNLKRMYRSSERNFASARHRWVELHTAQI